MNTINTVYTLQPSKKCPKCGEDMENKGNISGFIYTSNPVQRDETWICHKCKCKKIERLRGSSYDIEKYDNYTNV